MKKIIIYLLVVSILLTGCLSKASVPSSRSRGVSKGAAKITEYAPPEPELEPLGITLDIFKENFNRGIERVVFADYLLYDLSITAGEKYDYFEYAFPNQETLKGTVDKDGQLMLVEFSYPSFFDDKDLLFARTMGMASCILSFWISGNKA